MKIGIAGNGKIVREMIGAAKTVAGISIEAICSRAQSKAKAEKIACLVLLPLTLSKFRSRPLVFLNKIFKTSDCKTCKTSICRRRCRTLVA